MDSLSPKARTCTECSRMFTITVAEQDFLQALAAQQEREWRLPNRCLECRQARRRAAYTEPVLADVGDEHLSCIDCGERFVFGGKDREFFFSQGFPKPKRCRPCRRARQATRT